MNEEYVSLVHAMQSGVAFDIAAHGEKRAGADPKHLRVGVNVALVESSALWTLLVRKGIISEEEKVASLTEAHIAEVQRYEDHLSKTTGAKVVLKRGGSE